MPGDQDFFTSSRLRGRTQLTSTSTARSRIGRVVSDEGRKLRMTASTEAVLSCLLADPERERYGLEICREVKFPPGTVHPILARLLGMGWLESRFEDVDPTEARRPRRRYYRLTGDGFQFAHNALVRAEHTRARSSRGLGALRPREA